MSIKECVNSYTNHGVITKYVSEFQIERSRSTTQPVLMVEIATRPTINKYQIPLDEINTENHQSYPLRPTRITLSFNTASSYQAS